MATKKPNAKLPLLRGEVRFTAMSSPGLEGISRAIPLTWVDEFTTSTTGLTAVLLGMPLSLAVARLFGGLSLFPGLGLYIVLTLGLMYLAVRLSEKQQQESMMRRIRLSRNMAPAQEAVRNFLAEHPEVGEGDYLDPPAWRSLSGQPLGRKDKNGYLFLWTGEEVAVAFERDTKNLVLVG